MNGIIPVRGCGAGRRQIFFCIVDLCSRCPSNILLDERASHARRSATNFRRSHGRHFSMVDHGKYLSLIVNTNLKYLLTNAL